MTKLESVSRANSVELEAMSLSSSKLFHIARQQLETIVLSLHL